MHNHARDCQHESDDRKDKPDRSLRLREHDSASGSGREPTRTRPGDPSADEEKREPHQSEVTREELDRVVHVVAPGGSIRRLTGRASAASEEPKAMSESAARAC